MNGDIATPTTKQNKELINAPSFNPAHANILVITIDTTVNTFTAPSKAEQSPPLNIGMCMPV